MKKILLVVFIMLIVCLASIYIFILSRINVSSSAVVPCVPKNVAVAVNDPDKWRKWWPGQNAKADDPFFYNAYSYRLTDRFTDGAEIVVRTNNEEVASRIVVIPLGKDSS